MAVGVLHDRTLVHGLEQEHRLLLHAFGQVKKSAETADPQAFKRHLQELKDLLVPHVVKEAFKLYTYLRQHFKDSGERAGYEQVNAYKKEMSGIGDAALRFIDNCLQTPDQALDFAQIQTALRDIGHLLGDRIRREESELYPLYQSIH